VCKEPSERMQHIFLQINCLMPLPEFWIVFCFYGQIKLTVIYMYINNVLKLFDIGILENKVCFEFCLIQECMLSLTIECEMFL
jgi:hypothetical protein